MIGAQCSDGLGKMSYHLVEKTVAPPSTSSSEKVEVRGPCQGTATRPTRDWLSGLNCSWRMEQPARSLEKRYEPRRWPPGSSQEKSWLGSRFGRYFRSPAGSFRP